MFRTYYLPGKFSAFCLNTYDEDGESKILIMGYYGNQIIYQYHPDKKQYVYYDKYSF